MTKKLKIRPLHDRIIVKRLEEEEKTFSMVGTLEFDFGSYVIKSLETTGSISEAASMSKQKIKKSSDLILDQSLTMEVEDLFDSLAVTDIDMLREDFMASNLDGNHLSKTAKPR